MFLLLYFILSFITGLTIILFRNKSYSFVMTILFGVLNLVFVIHCCLNIGATELNYFTIDHASVFFLSILAILTFTTIYHGFIYLKNEEIKRYNIYHSALISLVVFMSGTYLANSVTVVWIFVEATTLAVASLIYHDRTAESLEATWKYVFVCSIGIALAYIGILFIGLTISGGNSLNLSFISLAQIISKADTLYLKIAFIFVLVGYSTKMGLFPMHTVTIDAHTVSPPPVSAFISTTLMNVGFIAIFRVYKLFSATAILPFMNHVLLLSGILSVLIASGYMLKAKHNKRMLAYSSLENMGIVAIGLGIGGIGYYAAFLHILLHSFSKAGLFYQVGQTYKIMGTYQLDESGNYMKLFPAGGIALLLGIICITAIPPSGLFISEFLLFKAMVIKGNYVILILTLFLLCFVLYALMIRVMHILYSQPRKIVNRPDFKIGFVQTISQYILFGIVIYICFMQPQFLKDIINAIIDNLPK
jgi:hydrogenase-4 component F